MTRGVRVTQEDHIKAADDAVRQAQQALVNLKGQLATAHGAIDPAAVYGAQTAARDVKAAAAEILDALRPLVIEAQAAQAAAEEISLA